MNNPFLLSAESDLLAHADIGLATVASVTSSGVTIIQDGDAEASTKAYKTLTSYSGPVAGDRVVVLKHSGTCVVLGKIGVGSDEVYYTDVTSEILTTNSDFTVNSASYAQWGKLAAVIVGGTFTKASSSSSDETVAFTMVTGKRPRITSIARAWRNANAILYANGNMVYTGIALSGNTATFLSTYLLA